MQKLGQLLLNLNTLPEEALENFKSTLWSSTPISSKTMIAILENELGKKTGDIFSEFRTEPIGVGSVAQVHYAKLLSGEEVAVKIQYPDLDRINRQDLAMLGRLFSMLKWVFPNIDYRMLIQLFNKVLENESDFLFEASILQQISKEFSGSESIIFPKVYSQLSSRKVLVTEYIKGRNFYQFIETSTKKEREAAALSISKVSLALYFKTRYVQLDPHPANYIFPSSDKVACIDYGCCLKIPTDMNLELGKKLIEHANEKSISTFKSLVVESGLIDPDAIEKQEYLDEFINLIYQSYNWTHTKSHEVEKRFFHLLFNKGFNKAVKTPSIHFFLYAISNLQVVKTIAKLDVDEDETVAGRLLEIA
ncbi:MAG: AarF/ABC1/UbiB kinase family protein [Oligoflexales bacterium]|nr:AarF/ABC1/UbiB kinase family protein [Oligoflexales bacterium]